MRPIKLTMSAFGPYAEKTVAELDKLGETGLYLITGDTGAGKTTIFDAIVYVLFGDKNAARSGAMLRSKYADPSCETYVELEFMYNGELYTARRNPEYERPAKRGGGMTKQTADAQLILPGGRVITKTKDVTKTIEEIIGLNGEQFTQIAMIQQGEFRKLLLAGTEDRIAIFRKLFKTDNYSLLQKRINDDTRALREECEGLEVSIRQYISGVKCGASSPIREETGNIGDMSVDEAYSLIERIIDEDRETEKKHTEKKKENENILRVLDEKIGRADNVLKTKAELEKAESELKMKEADIIKLERQYAEEKERLPKRDSIAAEITTSEKELEEYNVLEDIEKETAVTAEKKKKYENSLEENNKKLLRLKEDIKKAKSEAEELKNAAVEAAELRGKADDIKKSADAALKLIEDIKKYEAAAEQLKEEKLLFEVLINEARQAKNDYDTKNEAYLSEQAGILAAALEDRKPCPVCGSLIHPEPAAVTKGAPTKRQLDNAKKLSEEKQKKAAEASEQAGKTKALVSERELGIKTDFSELMNTDEVLLITDIKERLLIYINKLKEESDAVAVRLSDAESQAARCEALNKAVPELENDAAEREKAVSDIKTSIELSAYALKANKERYDELNKRLKFPTKAKALENIKKLKKEHKSITDAFDNAEKEYNECKNATAALDAKAATLREQLQNDDETLDAEELKKQRAELKEQSEKTEALLKELASRISGNKNALSGIGEKRKKLSEKEKRLRWMKALSDTANGALNGKEKIKLETYVQMGYFDRIIARANNRLSVMTGGQYEMKRREESENARSQSGLELDVIDHYNGTERSVKTLSGGETFKASLSLALGLAEEIQSAAGGIQLDTMFVDEGFGSLDEDSLRQAMQALADLSDGSKLVGIISHVAELKEKIDKQIVVTKDKIGGSKITIL